MTTPNWTQGPWSALLCYSETLQKVVRSWKSFMENDFTPDYFTDDDIRSWIERFEHSMLALRDLYVYDPLRNLQIHPVASGFPERLNVRILENMRSNEVVDGRALRESWLDHLFAEKVVNHGLLERMAKNDARKRINQHGTLKLFGINRLQRLPKENGRPAYVCCFERYCRIHRPSLHILVFESSEDPLGPELLTELTTVLREESSSLPRLGTMARHIDHAIAVIHPVWLGRISLGPIFVSHVTHDDHELQKVLDTSTPPDEFVAASRFIYEHVLADKAEPVQTLFDPKGRKHEFLQRFAIREMHEECQERGVTELEKHLFAPHHIVQALDETFRQSVGHHITIVEK